MTATAWIWTDVKAEDLKVGDVVQDSYANPAIVFRTGSTKFQVSIMQLVGSDEGRSTCLPTYIRRLDTPDVAEKIREHGRAIWRERSAKKNGK